MPLNMIFMKYKKLLKLSLFIGVLQVVDVHAMKRDIELGIPLTITRNASTRSEASLNFDSWEKRFDGTKEKACYTLLIETLRSLQLNSNQNQIKELGNSLYLVDDLTVPALISNFLHEQELIHDTAAKEITNYHTVESKIINIIHFLVPQLFERPELLEIPGFGIMTENEAVSRFSLDTTYAWHRRTHLESWLPPHFSARRNSALKLLSELIWFNETQLGGKNGAIATLFEVREDEDKAGYHMPLFTQDKVPKLINILSHMSNVGSEDNKRVAKKFSILTRLWANTNNHAIEQHNNHVRSIAFIAINSTAIISLIPLSFAAYYVIGRALNNAWANDVYNLQNNVNAYVYPSCQLIQENNALLISNQAQLNSQENQLNLIARQVNILYLTFAAPSAVPSFIPSTAPSFAPSWIPSAVPSFNPSADPSFTPSLTPSAEPTYDPSAAPSLAPSEAPSVDPSYIPSLAPSLFPSISANAVPVPVSSGGGGSTPTH